MKRHKNQVITCTGLSFLVYTCCSVIHLGQYLSLIFLLSDELLIIFVLRQSGIQQEDLHVILSVLPLSCLAVCDLTCRVNSIFIKQSHLRGIEMTHFSFLTLSRCIKINISLFRAAGMMHSDRSGYSWLISSRVSLRDEFKTAPAGHSMYAPVMLWPRRQLT